MIGGAFKVEVTAPADGAVIVAAHGDCDMACKERFFAAISDAESRAPSLLVLDLSGLTFMDSTGLNLLLGTRGRAEQEDRQLVIVGGSPQVTRIFEVAGLLEVFAMASNLQDALDGSRGAGVLRARIDGG